MITVTAAMKQFIQANQRPAQRELRYVDAPMRARFERACPACQALLLVELECPNGHDCNGRFYVIELSTRRVAAEVVQSGPEHEVVSRVYWARWFDPECLHQLAA